MGNYMILEALQAKICQDGVATLGGAGKIIGACRQICQPQPSRGTFFGL